MDSTPASRRSQLLTIFVPKLKPEQIYLLQKLSYEQEKIQSNHLLSDIYYLEIFFYVLLRQQNIPNTETKRSIIYTKLSGLPRKYSAVNIDFFPEEPKRKITKQFNFPLILQTISSAVLKNVTKFHLKNKNQLNALTVVKAFAAKMQMPLVYGDLERVQSIIKCLQNKIVFDCQGVENADFEFTYGENDGEKGYTVIDMIYNEGFDRKKMAEEKDDEK